MARKDFLENNIKFYMDLIILLTIFLTIVGIWLFNNFNSFSDFKYLIAMMTGILLVGLVFLLRLKANENIKELFK